MEDLDFEKYTKEVVLKLEKPVKEIIIEPVIKNLITNCTLIEKSIVERSVEDIQSIASLFNSTKGTDNYGLDSIVLYSNEERQVTLHSDMSCSILNKTLQPSRFINFSEVNYRVVIIYEDKTHEVQLW